MGDTRVGQHFNIKIIFENFVSWVAVRVGIDGKLFEVSTSSHTESHTILSNYQTLNSLHIVNPLTMNKLSF